MVAAVKDKASFSGWNGTWTVLGDQIDMLVGGRVYAAPIIAFWPRWTLFWLPQLEDVQWVMDHGQRVVMLDRILDWWLCDKNVFIVRQEHVAKKPELKTGDVFLQCSNIDDATQIMRAMGHRKYDGRQIQMTSFEDDKWYSLIKPLL